MQISRVLLMVWLCVCSLQANQHVGTVRAADQFLPGATVTARKGDVKVVAFTDENGRYTLELEPGAWELQVELLGFPAVKDSIIVAANEPPKDWVLDMPRYGETKAPPAATGPAGTAAAVKPGTAASVKARGIGEKGRPG